MSFNKVAQNCLKYITFKFNIKIPRNAFFSPQELNIVQIYPKMAFSLVALP